MAARTRCCSSCCGVNEGCADCAPALQRRHLSEDQHDALLMQASTCTCLLQRQRINTYRMTPIPRQQDPNVRLLSDLGVVELIIPLAGLNMLQ